MIVFCLLSCRKLSVAIYLPTELHLSLSSPISLQRVFILAEVIMAIATTFWFRIVIKLINNVYMQVNFWVKEIALKQDSILTVPGSIEISVSKSLHVYFCKRNVQSRLCLQLSV